MAERDKELGRSFVYPKTLAKSERTIIKKARFVDTPKPVKYPYKNKIPNDSKLANLILHLSFLIR